MFNSTAMLKMALKEKEAKIEEMEKQLNNLKEQLENSQMSNVKKAVNWFSNLTGKKRIEHSNEEKTKIPQPVYRVPVQTFIDTVKDYDVIAFDVFDTLVLQNIRTHNDIYDLVGLESGFESFADLRMEAFNQVSKTSDAQGKQFKLKDIYELLGQWIGIDSEKVMDIEITVEQTLSTANSYMKQVFDNLISLGKEIIITADTYLPLDVVKKILSNCGYSGYRNLFVSNEFGCSKTDGSMYEYINNFYSEKKIIHIGDEYINDIVNANAKGWQAVCYFPCRDISPYRFTGAQSPVGDIHSGIVTNKIYSASDDYSIGYKHGYVYGGILTVGYCKWLEKFSLSNNADKILFLARDAQIFSEIFEKHINTVPHQYMLVSRFAMWQIVFDIHTEEYIRFFFRNRAYAANTRIDDALIETGLDFLVEKLPEWGIDRTVILDSSTYFDVRQFIYDNKSVISKQFAPARNAATDYFNECFGTAKKIVLSDIGWSGQILIHMRHFVRDVMKRDDIEIIGAFMAANMRKDINNYVNTGILNSYLFTYGQNRDMNILLENNIGNTALMCVEAMYSSSSPTLMGYCISADGNRDFIFGQETVNTAIISDIQKGIMDFASDWFEIIANINVNMDITAADAFAPYEDIAFDWKYLSQVFGQFAEYMDSLPRLGKSRMYKTLQEIMVERGII